MKAYRQAQHDVLWVLDSNVMVDSGTLARSIQVLDSTTSPPWGHRRIALVHHVPFAFAMDNALGTQIEQAFLNTNHAKMYIAINTVAIESCVVGKSNIYRKSDLERLDGSLKPASVTSGRPEEKGLAAFGQFLAEDAMIACSLWHELDLRHDLSSDVAKNAIGNMSLEDYFWRRVRWIRVRKRIVLAATLTEPFTESIVAGTLASFGLRYLFGIPQAVFLPVHFFVWLAVDLDVYKSLAGHPLPLGRTWWKFIGAWVLRECLALPIWLFAIWGSRVSWGGRQYEIMQKGVTRKLGHDTGRNWLDFRWRGSRRKDSNQYEPLDLAQD